MKKLVGFHNDVKVEGFFKPSKFMSKDFDGDLLIVVHSEDLKGIHAKAKEMAESNLIKFGSNPYQFTIECIFDTQVEELFDQVCGVYEFEYNL